VRLAQRMQGAHIASDGKLWPSQWTEHDETWYVGWPPLLVVPVSRACTTGNIQVVGVSFCGDCCVDT